MDSDIRWQMDLARQLLHVQELTMCLVRDGRPLVTDRRKGLVPLLSALDTFGPELVGAVLADRVVGRAAAVIAVHAQLAAVSAGVLSSGAAALLDGAGIPYEAGAIVPHICDRSGKGVCPMEKIALEHANAPTAKIIGNMRDSLVRMAAGSPSTNDAKG